MQTLTPKEMQQVSGGSISQGGFGPLLIVKLILCALRTDFGGDGGNGGTPWNGGGCGGNNNPVP